MTPAAPTIPAPFRAWLATRGLTPRQLQTAEWFYAYQQAHAVAPRLQDMADGLAVSKVTVFEHVKALCSKGVLARRDGGNKARGLRLLWGDGSLDGDGLRAEAQLIRRVGEEIRKSFPGYAHKLAECAGRLEAAAGTDGRVTA